MKKSKTIRTFYSSKASINLIKKSKKKFKIRIKMRAKSSKRKSKIKANIQFQKFNLINRRGIMVRLSLMKMMKSLKSAGTVIRPSSRTTSEAGNSF